MSQILTDSSSKDAAFGFEPGDTKVQAMRFQTDEGTNCQANMVTLRDFQSVLSTHNTRELFETAIPKGHNFFNVHHQLAGSPVFCIAVCGDCPKHLDQVKLQIVWKILQRDLERLKSEIVKALE